MRSYGVIITGGPKKGDVRTINRISGRSALRSRGAVIVGVLALAGATAAAANAAPGAIVQVSHCAGQNAEVIQAVDGKWVYEVWIGCGGIGFARSADSGRTFSQPIVMPESPGQGHYPSGIEAGLPEFGWDPSIAVAPNGTVYLAYMVYRHDYDHPVVAASFNHGASFAQVVDVIPPVKQDWGDRDYLAVAPDGTVYLTWDYGQSLATRLANIVIQKSTDSGKTWSPVTPVSPGFPDHGGGVGGLILVEPSGRVDILFWVLDGGVPKPVLAGGHIYFTASADQGQSWSRPVAIQPGAGKIGSMVTWIDGNLGMDAAGNLYATWDTQGPGGDTGWLSFSTDHGHTWSQAFRATTDHDNAEHIMAVIGGQAGVAYVGWLADNANPGFAQYLRPFAIGHGWLCGPAQVSTGFGAPPVWPGDTIGMSALPGEPGGKTTIMLSWGSAVDGTTSQIWATSVPAC
jgi:hypothetical protein